MKKLFYLTACWLLASTAHAQDFEWAKRMGGTGNDQGRAIVVDGAGNVYTTGYFEGTVDFDPGPGIFNLTSAGSADIFISKLDAEGNFLWAKRIGGMGDDIATAIAVDGAGNVYITGFFYDFLEFDLSSGGTLTITSAGEADIFISKLNAAGNFVWIEGIRGVGNNRSNAIAVDGVGNVYTTGEFWGTADFDPGPGTFNLTSAGFEGYHDIFISKLNAAGNFVWAKRMGGTDVDVSRAIALDGVGDVYTTGSFRGTVDFDPGPGTFNLTSAGGFDIFISKLNANGNFVWAKRLGGTGESEGGRAIALDGAGNVYTTGFFEGTVDFVPGPGTFNLTSAGSADIFVHKLNASGNFVWAKRLGGTGWDVPTAIALDGAGNVYTTGEFWGTADFDPGPGIFNLTSAGNWDIFINKLNASGNFVWAKRMGGTLNALARAIALDDAGNVYTTGSFSGTADFDPGPGTFNLTAAGQSFLPDIFVHKLREEAPLSGLYTIGGTAPDFATFGAAVTALTNRGISGKVTFRARPGVYQEQISIPSITGASASDSIIFERASGAVTLRHAAAGAGDNFVVRIQDAGFVHLRNLGLQATGTGDFTRVLVWTGSVSNLSAVGCTLSAPLTSDTLLTQTLVFGRVWSMSNFVFRGNTLTGGSHGLNVAGNLNSVRAVGMVIEDNVISNFGAIGVSLREQQAPVLRRNTLSATGSNASGLRLTRCDGNLRVVSNRIRVSGQSLRLNDCQGTTALPGVVANNFLVSTASGSDNGGVRVELSSQQRLYHNNVRSVGYSLSISGGTNNEVRNNILTSTGTGNTGGGVRYTSATVVSGSNHNNFFVSGSTGQVGGTSYATLSSLQTGTGLDINSISVDPQFVNAATGNLTATASALSGAGLNLLSVVPTDINGTARANPPSIGANELTPTQLLRPLRSALLVYPNPATEQLRVSGWAVPNAARVMVLYDALGRRVRQVQAPGLVAELDVSTLPAGVYSLCVHDGRQAHTEKVVIRR